MRRSAAANDREPLKRMGCASRSTAPASTPPTPALAAHLGARRQRRGRARSTSRPATVPASELVLNEAHYASAQARSRAAAPRHATRSAGPASAAATHWRRRRRPHRAPGDSRLVSRCAARRVLLAEPRLADAPLRQHRSVAPTQRRPSWSSDPVEQCLAGRDPLANFEQASRRSASAAQRDRPGRAEDLLRCPAARRARGLSASSRDLAARARPVRFPGHDSPRLSAHPDQSIRRAGARARPAHGTRLARAARRVSAPGRGRRTQPAPTAAGWPRTRPAGPLHGPPRARPLRRSSPAPYGGGAARATSAPRSSRSRRRTASTRFANDLQSACSRTNRARSWWNRSATFQVVNRGKRSLGLDLSCAEGRDVLRELIAVSDVMIDNFTPRVLRGWDLTYERVRDCNPGLVMLSNTGYGSTGPWSEFRAQGTTLEATMGISGVTGYAQGKPSRAGQSYPDFIACWSGLTMLMAALIHRERSGEGQLIDLGMYQLGPVVIPEALLGYQAHGEELARRGPSDIDVLLSAAPPVGLPCCAGSPTRSEPTPTSSSRSNVSTSACRSPRCTVSPPARRRTSTTSPRQSSSFTDARSRSVTSSSTTRAQAGRRRGADHAVERAADALDLAHRAVPRGRQHARAEARRVVAADRDAARRTDRRDRPAARGLQRRPRLRRDRRCTARRHPDVQLVCFTGEGATAEKIMAGGAPDAQALLVRARRQVAGCGVCRLRRRARVDAAVAQIFTMNGQRCTAGSRLLVEQPIYDDFVAAVAARARAIRVGDPFEPATELGPLIRPEHHQRVSAYIESALARRRRAARGRRPSVGLARRELPRGDGPRGRGAGMARSSTRRSSDRFSSRRRSPMRRGVALANATEYGLAAYVWTSDVGRAHRVAQAIDTGLCWINSHRTCATCGRRSAAQGAAASAARAATTASSSTASSRPSTSRSADHRDPAARPRQDAVSDGRPRRSRCGRGRAPAVRHHARRARRAARARPRRSRDFYVEQLGMIVAAETSDALYLRGWEERLHHSSCCAPAATAAGGDTSRSASATRRPRSLLPRLRR
jgi:crotonobetainyl-CoA:carnitine CoA-transferase CaiB-like acyl-CoA transferase